MAKIIPPARPKMTHQEALIMAHAAGLAKHPVVMFGIREYYKKTMGDPEKNDRGIFDDALGVVTPTAFMIINGNTDPSGFRKGYGTSESTKGMASLKEGVWWYKKGLHKGRKAFVQARPFTVYRDANTAKVPASKIIQLDGFPVYEHTGWFGINHHNSTNPAGTGSAGCQTAPTNQHKVLREFIYGLFDLYGIDEAPYLLTRL